jgi:hypothetical protein
MYLQMTFKSLGGWNKHKLRLMAKGNQMLTATDNCLARIKKT